MLLSGPSGSGKSLLGTHFIAEGLRQGEPAIVAVFEEIPSEYMQRAAAFGFDFAAPQQTGILKILYLRPLVPRRRPLVVLRKWLLLEILRACHLAFLLLHLQVLKE